MGYPVAYLSGNTTTYETGMFKRGTIGQNQAATLTGNYRWWNGIDVTSSQYLIYSDTFTTSASTEANATPAAWSTPDLTDQSLLALINTLPERVGKLPFTYLPVALQWIQSTGRYFLLNNGYENIVRNGLTLNLDAGWYLSYSGTGTNWKDLSSNNLNGTLTNGPTFSNINGGSIVFDGVDDYIDLTSNVDYLSTLTEGTIEQWVKFDTGQTSCTTFFIGRDVNNRFEFVFGNRGSVINESIGIICVQGGVQTLVFFLISNSSSFFFDNQWHLFTYKSDSNGNSLYVDGVKQNVQYSNGSASTQQFFNISGGSTICNLGRRILSGTPSQLMRGNMAITHIYNISLTDQEILQNYNSQKVRFGFTADTIVTSGLTINLDAGNIISYPTTGTSWYDISYNNYNASLNNGITFSSLSGGTFILDGTDDYVNIPNGFTNMFKGKTHWTASIWIKVNNWGSGNDQYPVLVSIGENQGQYTELYLEIGNAGQYYFAYAGDFTAGSLTTNLNQVYNLVYMKDGSSFKVYRDGVLIDTVTGKNNVSNVDGDLWLGRFKTGDFDLNGNIYNFSMYNRALTGSEVLQNYNALKGRFGL